MYISKSILAAVAALFVGLGGGYLMWGTTQAQMADVDPVHVARAVDVGEVLDRAAVRQIVEDYIVENPVVIMQSVDDFQRNGFVRQIETRAEPFVAILEATEDAAIVGDPAAPIKIVEFFDYQCPHCKANYPVLKRLLEEDPSIVLLPKHLPILGDGSDQDMSLFAARVAEAARLQRRFSEFHEALMDREAPLSRQSILQTAQSVELDMERLAVDIESAEVRDAVDESRAMANDIGIAQAGTPGYIIGGKVMIGAGPDAYERLKDMINQARGS